MSYAFIAHWSSTHEGHGEVRPRMKLETCLVQVVGACYSIRNPVGHTHIGRTYIRAYVS